MSKDKFLFLGVLLILCAACKIGNPLYIANENVYAVELDSDSEQGPLRTSSYFESVEVIVLENSDQSLIGHLSKVDVCKDLIITLDKKSENSILLFDKSGKFLHKIGQGGGAPGEYESADDFTIDAQNMEIYVLDGQKQRVNKYDLISGRFVESILINSKSKVYSHHIQYIENSLFADIYASGTDGTNFLFQKIDLSNGKTDEEYLETDTYNKGWKNFNFIEERVFYPISNTEFRFFTQFMDTIVSVNANQISPYLVIQSKDLMTAKNLSTIDRHDFLHFPMQLFRMNKIYKIQSYIEHKNIIHFTYLHGMRQKHVLYDKSNKSCKIFNYTEDDLLCATDNTASHWLRYACVKEEGLYRYVNSDRMDDFVSYVKEGNLAGSIIGADRLENLNEDSNPVVLFYKNK